MMTDIANMTDLDLTDYLVNSADVPADMRYSYNAGYFESLILTMMARYPAVREEVEQRVRFRMGERGELQDNVIRGHFEA